jgi:hypothetical protein
MPGTFVSNPPNRWRRRSRGSTTSRRGHFITDADAGVPILTQQFGDALKLVVEVAWGANIAAASGTWAWSDVTRDVLLDDAVELTPGRADESSVTNPAICKFTLDDRANRYSVSPLATNWPNVQRGTPVRVRVVYLGVSYTRFAGYATGFNPSWDETGRIPRSAVTAAGIMQRLSQGNDPLRSPLERALAGASPAPIVYYPLEDGANSTSVYSPLAGARPLTFIDLNFASASGLTGSGPVATWNADSTATFNVSPYTPSQHWEFHWYQKYNQPSSNTQVWKLVTTGTYDTWEVIANSTGTGANTVTVNAYSGGVQTVLVNAVAFPDFYTNWTHVRLILDEVVGTLTWTFECFKLGGLTGALSFGFLLGSAGIVQYGYSPASSALAGIAMGHLSVWAVAPGLNQDAAQTGYTGENSTTRISRLCAEQAVPIVVAGSSNQPMGPQPVSDLVSLLRECEQVDGGVLYDGQDFGISFLNRDHRENRPVAMTLDASAKVLGVGFRPVHDDQTIRNRWTVSRTAGSSATVEQTTGPTGSSVIGLYSDSKTLNTATDTVLADQAGWRVNLGTVPFYRYPTLMISLNAAPSLLAQWLATVLFTRIQITNLGSVALGQSSALVDLVMEGYDEVITSTTWDVVANCSPFDPWTVAVLASDSGDTGEFLCRLDTDGSTCGAAVAGSSSLTVTTPSGPLWTTVADDFPLYVTIGGLQITVTTITGATSPQTFTVDGTTVLKAINNGDAVTVWDETVLGL